MHSKSAYLFYLLAITSLFSSSFITILPSKNTTENISTHVTEKNDATTRDTFRQKTKPKDVFQLADSICQSVDVPYPLIYEIGQNESNWSYIQNKSGGTDFGDLQVIDKTFWYWYEKLNLTDGKTRKNYLVVGIHYLKYLHVKYGSWEKARFAYGRGHWRSPDTWTSLEKKFMSKIDFSKYDDIKN